MDTRRDRPQKYYVHNFSYLCVYINYTHHASFSPFLCFIFPDSILTSLEERNKEREKAASRANELQKIDVSTAKREWREFWSKESEGLLLYACQHGTMDTVKYFITRGVFSTTR